MLRFKKSLRETFFAPIKWLARYQQRSFETSDLIFDQVHSKFHEFLKSKPCGSSFHLLLRENDLVIMS